MTQKTARSVRWCVYTALTLSLMPHAHGVAMDCELHPNAFNPKVEAHVPHVQVKADLNGDGTNDFFYLAGSRKEGVTCMFFAQRTTDGTSLRMVHKHTGFFDTVGDFVGTKTPQILIPEELKDCGLDNGLEFVAAKFDEELAPWNKAWSKGYENFRSKKGDRLAMASFYPLNPVHVFEFRPDGGKTDLTEKAGALIDLKKKILLDTMANPNVSPVCKRELRFNYKRLQQYSQEWVPIALRKTTEQCIELTKLQLGSYSKDVVSFSDDCGAAYVARGPSKLAVEAVTIPSAFGTFAACGDTVKASVRLTIIDGREDVLANLRKLNPKIALDIDPHGEGLKVSYALASDGNVLNFPGETTQYGSVDRRRAFYPVNGKGSATAVLTPTVTCKAKDAIKAFNSTKKSDELLAIVQKELSLRMEYDLSN